MLKLDLKAEEQKTKQFKDRLMELGMDENLEFIQLPEAVNMITADIGVEQYGAYHVLLSDEVKEELLESSKRCLIEEIVKALFESGLVRFIFKTGYGPFDHPTVAAKLAVVPWERLTERAIRFKYFGGGLDA